MTTEFKKALLLLSNLILILVISCNENPAGKKNDIVVTDSAGTSEKTVMPDVPIVLKDVTLNEQTLISGKKLSSSPAIDPKFYAGLSMKAMDSTASAESSFKYHIIDTLFSRPGLNILLIGREYESENIIWIAVYDSHNRLLDKKMVYYDNAEGFLSVETVIKNNQVTITSYNEYAEGGSQKKTTAVFHFNQENKLIEQ